MGTDLATASILDNGRLTELKRQLKTGDPAAAREVARQFESLFMQMVLKAMRDAVPREGLFDNEASRLYQSLHDQQMSLHLGGGRGLGLAAMIEKQLANQAPRQILPLGPLPLNREPVSMPLDSTIPNALRGLALPPDRRHISPRGGSNSVPSPAASPDMANRDAQRAFADRLMPAAIEAERQTGVPAYFMVALAALETGWGRSVPTDKSGLASHNIFGIKAGRDWNGPTVDASTTEVIAGLAQTRVERFRSYDSYEEAFRDYSALLVSNPRYRGVLGTREPQQFARNLQAAGYATDPLYASKIERIIDSGIKHRSLPA